jgi:hypothetical protein
MCAQNNSGFGGNKALAPAVSSGCFHKNPSSCYLLARRVQRTLGAGRRIVAHSEAIHLAVQSLTLGLGIIGRSLGRARLVLHSSHGREQTRRYASKTAGQKAAETKGRTERVREAKMAARTRKNGKNDAVNPYSK